MKIINVIAASLDGKIATEELESDQSRLALGFGSRADQEHVRQQIKQADAIITGANSMRASKKAWDQRGRNGVFPHWLVMSRSGLDARLPFWQQFDLPRTVLSPNALPPFPDSNVTALVSGETHPAERAVEYLRDLGAETVLLFGGGQINRLFYEKKLVDELKITVSPMIVAKKGAPEFVVPQLPQPVKLALISSQSTDNHVFLHYSVLKL